MLTLHCSILILALQCRLVRSRSPPANHQSIISAHSAMSSNHYHQHQIQLVQMFCSKSFTKRPYIEPKLVIYYIPQALCKVLDKKHQTSSGDDISQTNVDFRSKPYILLPFPCVIVGVSSGNTLLPSTDACTYNITHTRLLNNQVR